MEASLDLHGKSRDQARRATGRFFASSRGAGRRAVLVVPLGDGDARTARHTVGMLVDSLDYVRAELVATLLAPGVMDRGEVREHPEYLAAAYRAGRDAVLQARQQG